MHHARTMQPPAFWDKDGPLPRLLTPLGQAFGLAGRLRRRFTTPRRASIPVICVGNLTVGGAGKTPTVLALARHLGARGEVPHLLTRGYGGRAKGPLRVDPARHDVEAVGDEALLLAGVAPTWVGRDRFRSARAAATAGATILIMDDGFQNPQLHQDLALIAVDGGTGFGNQRLLPAGPLRERPRDGFARAAAVVLIGEERQPISAGLPPALPCLAAELRLTGPLDFLRDKRLLAFAGIGRPAKFFESLERAGLDVVLTRSFPDHHRYRRQELLRLLETCGEYRAVAVTTAKDLVRIPRELRSRFRALDVELHFQSSDMLDRVLAPVTSGPITSA